MTEQKPRQSVEFPETRIHRAPAVRQTCSSRPFATQTPLTLPPTSAAAPRAFSGLTATARPQAMWFSSAVPAAAPRHPSERPPLPVALAPPSQGLPLAATQRLPPTRAAAPAPQFASVTTAPTQPVTTASVPAQVQAPVQAPVSAARPFAFPKLTASVRPQALWFPPPVSTAAPRQPPERRPLPAPPGPPRAALISPPAVPLTATQTFQPTRTAAASLFASAAAPPTQPATAASVQGQVQAPASAARPPASSGLTASMRPQAMWFPAATSTHPSERPPLPAASAPRSQAVALAAAQIFPPTRPAASAPPHASVTTAPTQPVTRASVPAQVQATEQAPASAARPPASSGLTASMRLQAMWFPAAASTHPSERPPLPAASAPRSQAVALAAAQMFPPTRPPASAPLFASVTTAPTQPVATASVPAQEQATEQATEQPSTVTAQQPSLVLLPPELPPEWASLTAKAAPPHAAPLQATEARTLTSTRTTATAPAEVRTFPSARTTATTMEAADGSAPVKTQTKAKARTAGEPSAKPAAEPSVKKVRKGKEQPKAKSKRVKEKRPGESKGQAMSLRNGRPVPPEVQRTIARFVDDVIETGVNGFRREFAELKRNPPKDFTTLAFAANPGRNRYKDVLCIDATRTVLTLGVPPEADYIHANWVRMESSDKTFIAAQAPLEHTISDFWRLCFQENVTTVIALCNVIEGGKRKSTQYWPLTVGQNMCFGCMQVINKAVSKEDRVMVYTVEIIPDGYSNSVIVRIYHLSEWPDRGVPEYGFCVLRLLRKIDKKVPCLVHCSAGIGRTGTAIAIDTIIQRLFKNIPTNVKSVVQELRQKRASSVQTEAQYLFIVTTVLSYIKVKMQTKFDDKIHTFRDDVKKANMV